MTKTVALKIFWSGHFLLKFLQRYDSAVRIVPSWYQILTLNQQMAAHVLLNWFLDVMRVLRVVKDSCLFFHLYFWWRKVFFFVSLNQNFIFNRGVWYSYIHQTYQRVLELFTIWGLLICWWFGGFDIHSFIICREMDL